MIAIPHSPAWHHAFDALAWVTAMAVGWEQHRRWPASDRALARVTAPSYFVALALGALTGAWSLGSLATLQGGVFALSHSVAGALAGGIVGVEAWKWRHGVTRSTGASFVAPFAAGLAVGRLGCLCAGLADYTYGTPTALPWAVDMGDQVGRHPVALYEALAMAAFLAVYWRARSRGVDWATTHAFHAAVIVYAGQRFVWEFLKPYPRLVGPFDLYHFLMLGLIAYGLAWWRRGRSSGRAQGGALPVPLADDEPVRHLP